MPTFAPFDVLPYAVAGVITGLWSKHIFRPFLFMMAFQAISACLFAYGPVCLTEETLEEHFLWKPLVFLATNVAGWAFMYVNAFARLISIPMLDSDEDDSRVRDRRYHGSVAFFFKMIIEWLFYPASIIAAWRWVPSPWDYIIICVWTLIYWIVVYFINRGDDVWYIYLSTGANAVRRNKKIDSDSGWVKFDPNPIIFHFWNGLALLAYVITASIVDHFYPLQFWPQLWTVVGLLALYAVIIAIIFFLFKEACFDDHDALDRIEANARSIKKQKKLQRAARLQEKAEKKKSTKAKKNPCATSP